MKKSLLVAALCLAAAGSWAFYPKAADQSGYLMVISRFSGTAFSSKGTVSVTFPDGQVQTQEIDSKTGTLNKVTGTFDQLHATELKKLNELRAQGWRVVSATQLSAAGAINETVYLLDK